VMPAHICCSALYAAIQPSLLAAAAAAAAYETMLTCMIVVQAIIMNFLGTFFKVVPLNGWEWLISFAIGLGSLPLSFLTRLISRAISPRHKTT
jgi:hypothetical protein